MDSTIQAMRARGFGVSINLLQPEADSYSPLLWHGRLVGVYTSANPDTGATTEEKFEYHAEATTIDELIELMYQRYHAAMDGRITHGCLRQS